MIPSWDEYHIQQAELASTKSKDSSTKVGAVIVGPDNESLATGFNGFARGVRDDVPERQERERRLKFTIHAESNALLAAARRGMPTKGCRIYVSRFPCASCAGMIVQAGLTEVVCREIEPGDGFNERWAEEHTIARTILREGGVKVRFIANGGEK